jgi:calcineurin-like phosphoesterase family protein
MNLDLKRTFVTSDLHFGHKNIVEFCQRPFADVDHMNEALVRRWNLCVPPTANVIVLGDFSFASKSKTQEILCSLNGFIYFVWGNHDRGREEWMLKTPGVIAGFDALRIKDNGKTIMMTHYPLESFREDYHLHGHTHGQSVPKYGRIDVGVDAYPAKAYAPVLITEWMQMIDEQRKTLPHNRY